MQMQHLKITCICHIIRQTISDQSKSIYEYTITMIRQIPNALLKFNYLLIMNLLLLLYTCIYNYNYIDSFIIYTDICSS